MNTNISKLLSGVVLLGASAFVHGAPISLSSSFSPSTLAPGETTTFSWGSSNAKFCEVVGLPGGDLFGRSGSKTFTATASLTATVYCENGNDNDMRVKSSRLSVATSEPIPKPTIEFFGPTRVSNAGTNYYSWNSSDADSCNMRLASDMDWKPVSINGSGNYGWESAGSFTLSLSCTGLGGTTQVDKYITVVDVTPEPPVEEPDDLLPQITAMYASPLIDTFEGLFVDVTWASSNADYCKYGDVELEPSGVQRIKITQEIGKFNITFTCYNNYGSVSKTITIDLGGGLSTMYQAKSDSIDADKHAPVNNTLSVVERISLNKLAINTDNAQFTRHDYNADGQADLFVVDSEKRLGYLLLNQQGKFSEISKLVKGMKDINQLDSVSVSSGQDSEVDAVNDITIRVTH